MNAFDILPQWLATAIIAGIFAMLGFFGRKLYDAIEEWRTKKANASKQLQKLVQLLDESRTVFDSQDHLVRQLSSSLRSQYDDTILNGIGYDEMFYEMYKKMSAEQRELFNLIRGITMNSMRRVNEELRQWGQENSARQLIGKSSSKVEFLDAQLLLLRKHLNIWFDKYESVFKSSERRSLVYLADEKSHGEPFPSELSNAVNEMLAELDPRAQGSIAQKRVQRENLFENLQRSNIELAQAYNATLEGLACAIELRERENEGHIQRVTEMTVRVAHAIGLSDDEIVHTQRGAILHDIGKMNIPDSILLKVGQLNDEERKVIHQHPIYAHEMLSPIVLLRPALDIPYCHHEKWDGTGYPRGLKGEQIPLAARIFAVVDVWDTLRSDRPYRRGWTQEKVLEYIMTQTGKDFDPQVVEVFLKVMDAI